MATLKKTITATLTMTEVLYDIMNETYLRGRSLQNGENYKEVANMFASLDDENADKILRSIKRSFAEVKTELSEYLDEDGKTTNNALINATDDLVLSLKMPTNFNEAATAGLAEAVHSYIVNKTVSDWYIVTNKNDAQDYLAIAASALDSIRKSASKRSRPKREDMPVKLK